MQVGIHSVYNPHRMRVKNYDVAVELMAKEDPSVETHPVQVNEDYIAPYI